MALLIFIEKKVKNNIQPNSKLSILLVFILIFIANHVWGYLGHFGYDDMHYAKLANDLSQGVFNPEDHFSYRITLIGLTSISYLLFGVNDFASALPSLLVSILSLTLVFFILRKQKLASLTVGLSLYSLSFWNLFYADKLMTDSLVSFFVLLTLFIIYEFKFEKTKLPTSIFALGAAFSLFLGFNSKGTIVLFFPLIAYFIIVDLLKKRDSKFWLYFIIFSLIFISGYFIFWRITTGNALDRFSAITQNSYLNLCSYSEQPILFTLKRIGYELILLLISSALIVPFIFLLATPLKVFSKATFEFENERSFFTTSAIILGLSSNFMSISANSYSPMCLDPRHYLFLVPVAGIAASLHFKNIFENQSAKYRFVLIVSTIFLISILKGFDTSWTLYFPLLIAAVLALFIRNSSKRVTILSILIPIALVIYPLKMAKYARKVSFRKQEQIIKNQILNRKDSCLVITDQVQKNMAQYFAGFQANSNCKFMTFDEFSPALFDHHISTYILINWYTQYLSKLDEQRLPYYAKNRNCQEKVFEDSTLNIQLFRITNLEKPVSILKSTNSFESPTKNWSNSPTNEKHVYSGSYSSFVDKYSATFSTNLDSLNITKNDELIIQTSFYLNLIGNATPLLVISIENDKKNEFWKGYSLTNQLKSHGNWMPVFVNEIIDLEKINLHSILKIYLLNDDQSELYLDNFNIELLTMPHQ